VPAPATLRRGVRLRLDRIGPGACHTVIERVAAIYDIHGNLPALEAVLDEIRGAHVDALVVGGDVVPGPMPREAIARLLALDTPVHFLRGNGDREVLARMRGIETGTVPAAFRNVIQWNADQLPADYEAVLDCWPPTVRLSVAGAGNVLFCHGTPTSDTQIFTRLTPDERVLALLEGVSDPLIVCGHTHMQFDRHVGSTRVVNAGSVGMPYGEPGAYWLLLGEGVELRRTEYDLAAAARRLRGSACPQAEYFVENNVLRCPTEAQMLEVLTKAELR
jgi:predicted phosphodiesterase